MDNEVKKTMTEESRFLPKPDRQYKDTLFRMLFGDRKNLLELYNALHGTSYTNEQALEIVTLENAIYMNMKNDIAFLMADYLNMFEHQSTKNPNMPLCSLFYIAREYEKLVDGQSLYSSSKIRLPAPRFIVFYNGIEQCSEKQLLNLSDLYTTPEMNPSLELKVTVLNINPGYNPDLTQQCRPLREYVQYVEKVRCYLKEMPIRQAVDCAVRECIDDGILKDFLLKFRKEAIQMSIFEYDAEKEIRLIRQDERQQGIELGIKQGLSQGISQGIKQGEEKKLRELAAKKKAKGMTVEKIAAELEEDVVTIQSLLQNC